jgi:signal recognition particle subunit SRP54
VFEQLSERIQGIVKGLRGRSRISEKDLEETLGRIRMALIEADVAVPVTNRFVASLRANLAGKEVLKSFTPHQVIVKAAYEELVALMGAPFKLSFSPRPPTVLVLFGLQGVGKTTLAAKLAARLRREGRSPLLVGADLARPAAVEQLRTLAEQAGVGFYSGQGSAVEVAREGVEAAGRLAKDVVIVDTQGRLAVDEELLAELGEIVSATDPTYCFLAVDAMMGQDALATAGRFKERVRLDALVLTKMDSDARGGAALSALAVTGVPVAYASVGERLQDLEPFYPDRLARRILGMGDVLGAIERIQATVDAQEAAAAAQKILEGRLTLEDYLAQLRQVKKLGSLASLLSMIPGLPKELAGIEIGDREIGRVEAIICSMTKEERERPEIIDFSRKKRIAAGAGVSHEEVSQLLNGFKEAQKMLASMGVMGQAVVKRAKKRVAKGRAKGGRYTPKGG